jgi:CheY-like chemotaxis protein
MDDEEMVRAVAQRMIERLGHDVELACHGKEAIDKYQQALGSDAPFDLVILDLTIKGGMGGQETIRSLKELDPRARCVVSSGYADNPVISEYQEYGFAGLLNKPYTLQALEKFLNGLHEGWV